jgi:hypothetical protein
VFQMGYPNHVLTLLHLISSLSKCFLDLYKQLHTITIPYTEHNIIQHHCKLPHMGNNNNISNSFFLEFRFFNTNRKKNFDLILFVYLVATLLQTLELTVEHLNTQYSPTFTFSFCDKIIFFLSLWTIIF